MSMKEPLVYPFPPSPPEEPLECPVCNQKPSMKGESPQLYFNCCGIDTDYQRHPESAVKQWNDLSRLFRRFSEDLQKHQ